jgi:hypothetical protein
MRRRRSPLRRSTIMNKRKFPLGQVVTTPGVLELIEKQGAALGILVPLLSRHQLGDWGDLDDEDKAENDLSVEKGFRILSAYHIHGEKVWIITEADRSVTTVLLPSEY